MKYVEKEIPILDEHDLLDEDGKVVFSIDADFLRDVARNNNQRVQETGDETPIVVGHTKDGAGEKEQPEIVGWARKFSVKPLYDTGRQAIWVLARFAKDKVDQVRKFPRRSVELWLRKKLIDPISLLGATTPERNLGVLRFQAGDQTYSAESPSEENMNKDEIVQSVLSALEETDVWKFMESLMKEASGDGAQADEGVLPPGPGVPGEQSPTMDASEGEKEDEEKPQKYSPAASNTSVPQMVKKNQSGDVVKLQAAYAKLEGTNSVLADQVIKLQAQVRGIRREKDLVQLESEGILFDRDEELSMIESMDDTQYAKHLDLIRKRYQKAPLGPGFQTVSRTASRQTSREEALRIAAYASEHGLKYEDAKNHLSEIVY